MDFPAAQSLDYSMIAGAAFDDLPAHIQTDFANDTQNISFRRIGIGADDEVRTAQGIEMGSMVRNEKRHIEEFAQLLGGRRRVHPKQLVEGFGRSHMVRFRTDAAN